MTATQRERPPSVARWLIEGVTTPISLVVDPAYLRRVAAFRIALLAVYVASLAVSSSPLDWRWQLAFAAFVATNGIAHAVHAAVAIRSGRLVAWVWWFAPFADLAAVATIMATQPPDLALVWGVAIIPLLFFSAAISWRTPYLILTWLAGAAGFIAALTVHSQFGERFDSGEVAIALTLLLVGSIVIVRTAVHLRALTNQLESQSRTDALTGLMNRRAFADHLHQPALVAPSTRFRPAVLVVDVDNFKRINDAYGHDIGDDRLREVADMLRAFVRREDLVYRYGGDEFVIIAPVADEAEAAVLAERIREAVHFNTETRISIGYAVAPSDAPDLTKALRGADRALLEAKRRGRGLVVPAAGVQPATTP
jgi:diguanylate cyclase (GGDEF)-like protein